jgi:hypothetical protein
MLTRAPCRRNGRFGSKCAGGLLARLSEEPRTGPELGDDSRTADSSWCSLTVEARLVVGACAAADIALVLGARATGVLAVLGRDESELAGAEDGREFGMTGAADGLDEGRTRAIGCELVGSGGGRPRSEGGGGRTDTRSGGGVGK